MYYVCLNKAEEEEEEEEEEEKWTCVRLARPNVLKGHHSCCILNRVSVLHPLQDKDKDKIEDSVPIPSKKIENSVGGEEEEEEDFSYSMIL